MLIRNVKEGAEKLENHINQKVEKLGTNTQLSQERQDESQLTTRQSTYDPNNVAGNRKDAKPTADTLQIQVSMEDNTK